MPVPFTKAHAYGNDFLFVPEKEFGDSLASYVSGLRKGQSKRLQHCLDAFKDFKPVFNEAADGGLEFGDSMEKAKDMTAKFPNIVIQNT